jgi:hypothetical protein
MLLTFTKAGGIVLGDSHLLVPHDLDYVKC